MRILELLLDRPLNTVVLTLCTCMVIFLIAFSIELVVKAVKGNGKVEVSGPDGTD